MQADLEEATERLSELIASARLRATERQVFERARGVVRVLLLAQRGVCAGRLCAPRCSRAVSATCFASWSRASTVRLLSRARRPGCLKAVASQRPSAAAAAAAAAVVAAVAAVAVVVVVVAAAAAVVVVAAVAAMVAPRHLGAAAVAAAARLLLVAVAGRRHCRRRRPRQAPQQEARASRRVARRKVSRRVVHLDLRPPLRPRGAPLTAVQMPGIRFMSAPTTASGS